MSVAEAVPVLCKRCGGRADVGPHWRLLCAFCHFEDQLPQQELARALELKNRLALAAREVAQLDGTERALAGIFEQRVAFWRATSSFVLVLAIALAYAVANVAQHLMAGAGGREVLLMFVLQTLPSLTFIGGFALAIAFALFVGRWRYRRTIRPLLLARPAISPMSPGRCRACGADLRASALALAVCKFCGTQSLLTKDVHEHRVRLLQDETRRHQDRLLGVGGATGRASLHMTRTLAVGIVLVYVGQFAIFGVTQVLVRGLVE